MSLTISPERYKHYADIVRHNYSSGAHNYGAITRLGNGTIVSTSNAAGSWDVRLKIKKFGERDYEDVFLDPSTFSKEGNIGHFAPVVTPFSNNTFLWSWTASNIPDASGENGTPGVHVAEYDDSGELIREILNLRSESEVGRVAVGTNNDGILLVSYMVKDPGNDKVEYVILDASSDTPVFIVDKSPIEQNTGAITDPVIAKRGDGFFIDHVREAVFY